MANGVVKWFDATKGYGFIKAEEGDIFVHVSKLQESGIDNLEEGQEVSYDLEDNRGRTAATNLKVVG